MCKQLLVQDCSFELWVNSVHNNGILQIQSGGNRSQLYKALQLLSTITENDQPVSSEVFYKTGFRARTGCYPTYNWISTAAHEKRES